MNWHLALLIILTGIISTYFLVRQIRRKNRFRNAGIAVVGIVTDRIVTTGRYATVRVHYQFSTLDGQHMHGVSESNPQLLLEVGNEVPVIYDAADSSNHALSSEAGTDKNLFSIALVWLGVLLLLFKVLRSF